MGAGELGRLSTRTLGAVAGKAKVPAYDRSAVTGGIVHLGIGAFHRAHQAVYVDDCLAAGDTGWAIVAASLRSPDTRDALAPQDGLFSVVSRSGTGDDIRIVGSVIDLLVAPEHPEALLDALSEPRIRIVTLTVTEKAYLRGPGGRLDAARDDVQWDLDNPDRPRTVFGFLIEALARRRQTGTPPFTVLCCDNLPANGATVRNLMLDFAGLRGDGIADHVEREVAFPSTMVDRIVPATTEADRVRVSAALGLDDAWPIMTEPFKQWVVEDHFPTGRPGWEAFGVTMVKDVRPFEDMKLRLLNGAHSAIAYLGLLLGYETVSGAFADPRIRTFTAGLWAEAIPTLPPGAGLDPLAYTKALAERFSNPALLHRTAQIAMDGSQKLPQRIFAAARDQARLAGPFAHLMLVPAAWIACCRARASGSPERAFTDPADAALAAIFARNSEPGDLVEEVFAAAGFEADSALAAAATRHLAAILSRGAAPAIEGVGRQRS